MKAFILLCVIGAALATRECPENQHYNSCGTACPLTCKNYKNPPKACVLMCVPGCHCDAGYVKTSDGRCVRPEECPSEARPVEKSCLAKPDPGMCYAYFPMWYYDPRTMSCLKFVYGGCGGNGNRYATQEECEESCTGVQESTNPICKLPAESGVCRAFFPRYYFDKLTGTCQKFVYGGCGGNENNFETEEECRRTCGESVLPVLQRPDCDQGPQPGPCRGYMPRYYYDEGAGMCKKFIYGGCGGNRNNFETEQECYNKCGALAAPSACSQAKEVGPCKAYFPRYFFNKESGKCEHFVYGGCQGNSNNFESLEDCEAVCVS